MKQRRPPPSTTANHVHPPRAQARSSGVEKPRHKRRNRRTLPAWYYRVMDICMREDRDAYGYDFDEDLSEMEYNSDGETENEDMDGDDESKRSYDGSDAEEYYEMKYAREDRKWEKRLERKEKEQEQERDRMKEEEVNATERALSRAETERKPISIESLAGQGFLLYSSDHVGHFYNDLYPTKTVNFYYLDDDGNQIMDKSKPVRYAGLLYGDIYLNVNASCPFGPFRPPKYASRKSVKTRCWAGGHELSITFLGNGHLKLRVSQDMVFMLPNCKSPPAIPPSAPKVFEFAGIWRDRRKEAAERKAMMARRSPSPRETWFEMNHPMGWWSEWRNM